MDMAKLMISMKISAVAVAGLMTFASIASGSVIVVSAVILIIFLNLTLFHIHFHWD